MDSNLSKLLQWSVTNTSTAPTDSSTDPSSTTTTTTAPPLPPDAIAALFGGPSDADLMRSSMSAIHSTDPEITLADKLIAFDNLEQLIENLDNANNLAPLELWTPLLACLAHAEPEMRTMAAWCVGTAVQNNEKSQERLLAMGGVERLVGLAVDKNEERGARRKAVYALSSACRNYQPSMTVLTQELGRLGREVGEVDASDMDACDVLIGGLREDAAAGK